MRSEYMKLKTEGSGNRGRKQEKIVVMIRKLNSMTGSATHLIRNAPSAILRARASTEEVSRETRHFFRIINQNFSIFDSINLMNSKSKIQKPTVESLSIIVLPLFTEFNKIKFVPII